MKTYTTIHGDILGVSGLEADEGELVERLRAEAAKSPDWTQFRNYWMAEIDRFYSAKGLSRRQIIDTTGYRIGEDLKSRLGISQGQMRLGDYRSELEMLILKNFPTRKAFCDATGLSEDMLSHVLARRKHLAVDTLTNALEKIGYTIHITPLPDLKSTSGA
jgi:hypothetical protein